MRAQLINLVAAMVALGVSLAHSAEEGGQGQI